MLELYGLVVGAPEPLVIGLQPHGDALGEAAGVPPAVEVDEEASQHEQQSML